MHEIKEGFKLGDYVTDVISRGHVGRVYQKYALFSSTGEDMDWFNSQRDQMNEESLTHPWYSILTLGGGSVLLPEYLISEIEPIDDLQNKRESFYFEVGE